MGDTSIQWTDKTWNPVRGCQKVSPGCKNCYAEAFAERFRGVKNHPYEQGFDLRLVPEKLAEPLTWRARQRVFVNSMSDLFWEQVPTAYVDRVFATILACHVVEEVPDHTFQVLTKRAGRMAEYFNAPKEELLGRWIRAGDESVVPPGRPFRFSQVVESVEAIEWPLPNLWLGVSVEDSKYGLPRVEELARTPAKVRFLSMEPLIEPVHVGDALATGMIDWVIIGGESGLKARPMDVSWVGDILEECRNAKVSPFVKQLGSVWAREHEAKRPDGRGGWVRDSHGGYMPAWPEWLRIREWPLAQVSQELPLFSGKEERP